MPTLIYRPDHPEANLNGMIEKYKDTRIDILGSSPYVIGDEMPPTRHMVTGEFFTSKAKFRSRTRDVNCVEVGNETATMLKPRKTIELSREQRHRDIRIALDQLRNGR